MIGTLDTRKKEVTIIGAGVSGLVAAYFLDQKSYEVTLIEALPQAGGMVRTVRTPYGISESAAHSIPGTTPVIELCDDLKVPLVSCLRDSRARYVWRKGMPKQIPLSLLEVTSTLWRLATTKKSEEPPSSLAEWGKRHMGQKALDYLLNPMVRGIYGCRPEDLLPKKPAASARGVKIVTPEKGMGALTSALESHLHQRLGVRFRRGEPIESLPKVQGNLILCTPPDISARLLSSSSSILAGKLSKVPFSPLISVTAFLPKQNVGFKSKGLGVLMPEVENRKCLGILFNSRSFVGRVTDPDRYESFTLMLGGTSDPGTLDLSQTELDNRVTSELQIVLGLQGDPAHLEYHRWRHAIPIYGRALQEASETAKETWCKSPGQILFGNFSGEVSIRGMIETFQKTKGYSP